MLNAGGADVEEHQAYPRRSDEASALPAAIRSRSGGFSTGRPSAGLRQAAVLRQRPSRLAPRASVSLRSACS